MSVLLPFQTNLHILIPDLTSLISVSAHCSTRPRQFTFGSSNKNTGAKLTPSLQSGQLTLVKAIDLANRNSFCLFLEDA